MGAAAELSRFIDEVSGPGPQLGVLLVQLAPSLELKTRNARAFFRALRERIVTPIVCEPRHETWFTEKGADLPRELEVGRVGADPARPPTESRPEMPSPHRGLTR